MKNKHALSYAELLSLESLIATAVAKGISPNDKLKNTEEQAEAMAEIHAAMWEARHGGIEISQRDRRTLTQMRELAKTLEFAPKLQQLMDLKAQALKEQRG